MEGIIGCMGINTRWRCKTARLAVVSIDSTTARWMFLRADFYRYGNPRASSTTRRDSLYFVNRSSPMRVSKSQINPVTGIGHSLEEDVDNLPASDLSDAAYFPRLSRIYS